MPSVASQIRQGNLSMMQQVCACPLGLQIKEECVSEVKGIEVDRH